MSVMKYAFAPVQEPVLDQRHWEQLHGERGRRSAAKFASASKKAGTKVILSHVTIMASVAVEPAPYDYLIRPESSHLVNHNGDAWVNEVLRMSYPTFRGAFNFVEHFQSTKASKGWIVDAVLRKVSLGPSPDLYTYYVDLLVATDFKHEDLVAKIRSGEVKYLSMGCLTDLITCSFCGASGDGSEPACFHLTDFGKTRKFRTDQWGVPRRVAELCFTPGSRVVMGDGSRRVISDVQEGDVVLSHTGARRSVTRTFIRDYTGPMVSLGIAGLPQKLTSTPNHPYWVISPRTHCQCGCGEPLAVRQQKFERREYTRSYLPGHNPATESLSVPDFVFKEASELRVGDLVAIPVPSETVIPSDVTLERAEVLGWFLAEGSYYSHKGKRDGVTFTLNGVDEIHVAERLRVLLAQAFPPERRKGSTNPANRKLPRVYHYARAEGGTKLVVNYNNTAAVDWLLHHAGEYAGTKRLSADAVLWPLDLQRTMLKAYVAGDGTVDGVARFSVASISETLISQMQLIAARCGLWTRRQVIFGGKAATLGDTLTSPRDHNNFRPLHTLHFQPSTETTQFFGAPTGLTHVRQLAPGWRQHDGYLLYRVTEVAAEDYSGPLHNFEVEADHSYLVEGIAVHNCGHPSLPGGGVRFIEASWVATPAFPGAARRNTVLDEWDLPEDLRVAKAASLDLSYALPKVASLAATDAPQLPTPSCERPASRILAELRRLR